MSADTPVGLTESEWVHEVLNGWIVFPVREGLDGSQMPMSQQSLELHLGRAVAALVAAERERADAAEAKIAAVEAKIAAVEALAEEWDREWSEWDGRAPYTGHAARKGAANRIRAELGGEATP